MPMTPMAKLERIARLERFATTAQNLLTELGKGDKRNRVAMRLAQLDQIIAKHKASIDCLGLDDCTYLDN